MFEKIKVFLKNQKHEPNIVEVTHMCIMHRVHTSCYISGLFIHNFSHVPCPRIFNKVSNVPFFKDLPRMFQIRHPWQHFDSVVFFGFKTSCLGSKKLGTWSREDKKIVSDGNMMLRDIMEYT